MANVLGIDLGSTYACLAILDKTTQNPCVLPMTENERRLPTVVAFCANGEVLLGSSAQRQAITNAGQTFSQIRNLAGQPLDAPAVQVLRAQLPFAVQGEAGDEARLLAGDEARSPAELLALQLLALKVVATDQLGGRVDRAVYTVPSTFTLAQRRALCDAARLAELPVDCLLSDGAAIALASGLCDAESQKVVAIVDAGGGRLQASILRCGQSKCTTLAALEDAAAGGTAYTQRLADHLREEFLRQHAIALEDDPVAMARLRDAGERLKRQLADGKDGEISLPFLSADAQGPKHLASAISRSTFESLCASLLERSVATVDAALRQAGLRQQGVDAWLLVGGGATLPGLRQRLEQRLQQPPTPLDHLAHLDELAALGAARVGTWLGSEAPAIAITEVGDAKLYAGKVAQRISEQVAPLSDEEFAAARHRLAPPPPLPLAADATP